MNGQVGDFAVRITAKDETAGVVNAVKKTLAGLGKAANGANLRPERISAFGQAGREIDQHFRRATRTVTDFTDASRQAAAKLTEFAPALGILTGAASLAGVAALTRDFGRFGVSVSNTAASLNVSTRDVQLWQRAFARGGVSATEATTSIAGLNKALLDARAGTNAQALATARWFHVDINASPLKAMRQIADVVKSMKDRGENPESQGQLLDSLGISRSFLPIMQGGAAAIDRLIDAQRRHGVVADQALARARALNEAWEDLKDSATLTGYAIANELTPVLKPALAAISEWLDKNREWVSNELADGVRRFGEALRETDWKQVGADIHGVAEGFLAISKAAGPALEAFKWLAEHPTIAGALIGAAGGSRFGPAGAVIGGVAGMTVGNMAGESDANAAWGAALGDWEREHSLGRDRRSFSEFERDFKASHPSGGAASAGGNHATTPAPAPASSSISASSWSTGPAQGRAAAPNDALFNWGSLRSRKGGWQAFSSSASGVQAVKDNLLRNYAGMTIGEIYNKWAPSKENNTQLLIDRASRMMGMSATARPDMTDREVMRRLVTTMIANEHGGVLPRDLSQNDIDRALGMGGGVASLIPYARGNAAPGGLSPVTGLDPEFASRVGRMVDAMPPELRSRFSIISGYRSPQREADMYREQHPGQAVPRHSRHSDGLAADLGWDPGVLSWIGQHPEYGVGFPLANLPAEGNHLEQIGDGSGSNTRHEVEVHFVNAPPGIRSGLRRKDGDAELSVRTSYAMPSNW